MWPGAECCQSNVELLLLPESCASAHQLISKHRGPRAYTVAKRCETSVRMRPRPADCMPLTAMCRSAGQDADLSEDSSSTKLKGGVLKLKLRDQRKHLDGTTAEMFDSECSSCVQKTRDLPQQIARPCKTDTVIACTQLTPVVRQRKGAERVLRCGVAEMALGSLPQSIKSSRAPSAIAKPFRHKYRAYNASTLSCRWSGPGRSILAADQQLQLQQIIRLSPLNWVPHEVIKATALVVLGGCWVSSKPA